MSSHYLKISSAITTMLCSALLNAEQVAAPPVPAADHQAIAPAETNGLSAAEIEKVRSQVLKRCGLSSKIRQNKLPWYFHYEFGVELMNQGAASLALEPLQLTANLRPESARSTRMYGMWYVNYLPYYQLSQAYAQTSDWDSAWAAISMSELYSELAVGDSGYEEFTSLKSRIHSQRESAEPR
jgi:hypothetical protein